jgi:putative endonuclease
MKHPAVYLMASQRNGTLYLGVTSDLARRVAEHRMHHRPGFTDRYHVTRLVWFEMHPTMESAIARETAIKRWRRAWKLELIEARNPEWNDLWGMITWANGLDSRVRGNDDEERAPG